MALADSKAAPSLITEESRLEAERQQALVIQGKGMMHGVKSANGYPGESGIGVGSFDMEQALINKALGYW